MLSTVKSNVVPNLRILIVCSTPNAYGASVLTFVEVVGPVCAYLNVASSYKPLPLSSLGDPKSKKLAKNFLPVPVVSVPFHSNSKFCISNSG